MWNEKSGTPVIGPHVPIKEEDMKKIVRLGKMNSVQEGKPRPVLIQFRDRV